MEINQLIEQITPLYNEYKTNSKTIKGTEALEIMWEIGEILKQFIETNNIAPHNLYRQIYGRSEGSENTSRRSYITREFLGRCYRIRNIFDLKASINNELPKLRRFITFREAMPFFDNPKYLFSGIDRENLLKILNSQDSNSAMTEIRKLQKKHIGIVNPRNQRLEEIGDDKDIFITFYNYIYDLLQNSEQVQMTSIKDVCVTKALVNILIQDTSALTEDGLKFSDHQLVYGGDDKKWVAYTNLINKYKFQNNPKLIRRFRRVVPPMRMINLAEMLNKIPIKE